MSRKLSHRVSTSVTEMQMAKSAVSTATWPVPNSRDTSRHFGSGEGGNAGVHIEFLAATGVHVFPEQGRKRVAIAGSVALGPVRAREDLLQHECVSAWKKGSDSLLVDVELTRSQ